MERRSNVEHLTRKEGRAVFEENIKKTLGITTREFLKGYNQGRFDYSHDNPDHTKVARILMLMPLIASDPHETAR